MRHTRVMRGAAAAGFLVLANVAGADTRSWDGGAGAADRSWSNPTNWAGDDAAPGPSDSAVFTNAVAVTVDIDASNPGVSNLTAIGVGGCSWTGASNVLDLGGIFNHSPGSSADSAFGAILAGGGSLLVGGGRSLSLNNNANTYAGGTVLSAGWIRANGSNTLGRGALTIRGGRLSGSNAGTTYTNAVELDGDAAFGWSNDGPTFTGPVTVMRDCTLTSSVSVSFGIGPAFVGDHAVRFTGPGGNAGIHRNNGGWGGSTIMDMSAAATIFRAGHAEAFGRTLTLRRGKLSPPDGAAVTVAAGTVIILDGDVDLGHVQGVSFAGPVTVTGHRTVTLNKDSTFSGTFAATNRCTLTKAGAGGILNIAGDNAAYTGDWHVAAGALYFSAANAIGRGQVGLATGATVRLNVNADWTLPNDFTGGGTLGVGAGATSARTLTLAGGILSPGTAASAGMLTVQNSAGTNYSAHLAFGAGSRLTIDVVGSNTVAGLDHDRLRVARGNVSGLENADLVVNVAPALGRLDLTGARLTVLVAGAGVVSNTFRSVTYTPGFHARVEYGTNEVALVDLAYRTGGSVVVVR